jgi:hypothetical protein
LGWIRADASKIGKSEEIGVIPEEFMESVAAALASYLGE